uniref:Uncharacterized protein n=1 Tax=Arundo donax TaxID=35708 RepID=A0A0A9HCG1_ARUDO
MDLEQVSSNIYSSEIDLVLKLMVLQSKKGKQTKSRLFLYYCTDGFN